MRNRMMKKGSLLLLVVLSLVLTGCHRYMRIGWRYYPVDYFYSEERAEEFVIAAKRGDEKKIDRYLSEGMDIDVLGRDGVTTLYLMILSNDLE